MYTFDLEQTQTGSFEVVVVVPREHKMIAGLEFPQAPITHRFTAAAAFSGEFDGLVFEDNGEREDFAKTVGQELISRGAQPVATHS